MLNLKDFRENKLKMTQTQLANLLGVNQDTISRYENNPERIPLDFASHLAQKTGITLDQLTNYEKPLIEEIKTEYTWGTNDLIKKTLIDYIKNSRPEMSEKRYDNFIDGLSDLVSGTVRKPKVAIVGRSDVGKSALINTIIGQEKMPTAWSPTTSIIVYLKHIMDKPNFIDSNVWIFKASSGNQSWDYDRLYDKDYCLQWKLVSGDIETLKSYGTRQGNRSHKPNEEAGAAVVFVDSSILRNCDILDLPGYGTGDRTEDDTLTQSASQCADILVYMSIANGFMRGEDINYLRQWIRTFNLVENANGNMEPLSNLFIVASQAHVIHNGNRKELSNILNLACERFAGTLSDDFWELSKDCKLTYEDLRARFFTFSIDIDDLCKDFKDNFKRIVEEIPRQIKDKVVSLIKQYVDNANVDICKEIAKYTEMLDQKEKYEQLLSEIDRNEPKRELENRIERENIVREIEDFHSKSLVEFKDEFDRIISVDSIVSIIKRKGYKKKRDDVELLSGYLSSSIEEIQQRILREKSEQFTQVVDRYIANYECSISKISLLDVKLTGITFNARRAFASGLTGMATFGGLAFWASTLGNLGAYILVAKGVSLLAALGIHVGGTAAAISVISAIGGPITLGIALSVLATMTAFAIFSGSWEKSLAKKLVKAYFEADALSKYEDTITIFWRNTQIAFDASADNMDREWKHYINNLRDIINNYDINDVRNRIATADNVKDFFTNIPL